MLAVVVGFMLGLVILFNFILMLNKFKQDRFLDVTIDIIIIIVVSLLYGVTIVGGMAATIGSLFISIYLYYKPLSTKKTMSVEELCDYWDNKIENM